MFCIPSPTIIFFQILYYTPGLLNGIEDFPLKQKDMTIREMVPFNLKITTYFAIEIIMIILQQTVPGQDVFIQGGQTDLSPIDIIINPMPEIWESYNSWMEGDDKLDWDGPQPDQGTFNGYDAMGTAAAWTTDDETNDFYYEGNPGKSSFLFATQKSCKVFHNQCRHC